MFDVDWFCVCDGWLLYLQNFKLQTSKRPIDLCLPDCDLWHRNASKKVGVDNAIPKDIRDDIN
jgi:hypothetical protein